MKNEQRGACGKRPGVIHLHERYGIGERFEPFELLQESKRGDRYGQVIYWFLTTSAGLFFFTAAGHGATQDFYQGKVIRIVVGFSPGGAFDAYSRSLSRHMRKYIAGNPTITVENMPGPEA